MFSSIAQLSSCLKLAIHWIFKLFYHNVYFAPWSWPSSVYVRDNWVLCSHTQSAHTHSTKVVSLMSNHNRWYLLKSCSVLLSFIFWLTYKVISQQISFDFQLCTSLTKEAISISLYKTKNLQYVYFYIILDFCMCLQQKKKKNFFLLCLFSSKNSRPHFNSTGHVFFVFCFS